MKKYANIIIGTIISAVCIYFAVKGINLTDLSKGFQSANYLFVIPVVLVVLLGHFLRSYRWGIIVESLVKYDQLTLFIISSIGFMAVGILPARLGEFARPYLVKQKSGIRMSSSMATIIVERVFDVFAILVVMFAVVLTISLPSIIFKMGISALTLAFFVFLGLIFLAVKKEFSMNIIDFISSKLPDRMGKRLKRLAHSFIEGLQILPDVKKTLYVAVLSLIVWLTISMSAYILFISFGFTLTIINAFAITVIVAMGVMLPAAPGFVGTYHYACVLGLTFFGVSKPAALSYAIVLHFLQMAPILALGLIFLPFQKISLPKFIQKEKAEIERESL